MRSLKSILFTLMLVSLLLVSCGKEKSGVESGIYSGKVVEIKPSEKEIYVVIEKQRSIALYFTDSTALTKNGEKVDFSQIKRNDDVEVKVEKTDEKLNPLAVKIK